MLLTLNVIYVAERALQARLSGTAFQITIDGHTVFFIETEKLAVANVKGHTLINSLQGTKFSVYGTHNGSGKESARGFSRRSTGILIELTELTSMSVNVIMMTKEGLATDDCSLKVETMNMT